MRPVVSLAVIREAKLLIAMGGKVTSASKATLILSASRFSGPPAEWRNSRAEERFFPRHLENGLS